MEGEDLLEIGRAWFSNKNWQPFPFQLQTWRAYLEGKNGLLNAPTGSGKTYALGIPILLQFIKANAADRGKEKNGLQAIWVTPIRALAKEIQFSLQEAATELGLNWQVAIRSGDTSSNERAKQKKRPPEILITTPESLHLLLASKGYPKFFGHLKAVIVDEWHELIGSKRGVQMELALSRFRGINSTLQVWGISATIGNIDEALDVLMGNSVRKSDIVTVRSEQQKEIEVATLLPEEIETFPWTGHLGLKMLEKVLPIIQQSTSTLIFTNTRAQCEMWYQRLLEVEPDLAGVIAMHHGSISKELRDWVENALHEGQLKAVVCTSSLDLGVDFRPVETIVQVGSPKGVARFLQRAGRSGHQPGATSRIYFAPTHSLELMEGAALRHAIEEKALESRIPYVRSFDVLIQYVTTLAVSEGFVPRQILPEIRSTFSYSTISDEEWAWVLEFITTGGQSLHAYDEYKKVIIENGLFKVDSRRIALRHRLGIGTIVSDASLQVKYVKGGRIGDIEEYFISQLSPGDVFWFAGRSLELVRVKDMIAQVKKSNKKTGRIPAWMGGRMSFSSELSDFLRVKMQEVKNENFTAPELEALIPLFDIQQSRSYLPGNDEFLIEYFQSKEGFHLVLYPFEGRAVHEGLGALLAYRFSQMQPQSFSIAMNDYGFELLSEQPIPIEKGLENGILSTKRLIQDIQSSVNAVEMARRRFRDIASIAGLIFKGFPGKQKKDRHLQSSSSLFFQVFQDYEPDNLLLMQAFEEVTTFQLEEIRMRKALNRIANQKILFSQPEKATPFAFPIIVDRLREKLTSERLENRIKRMKLQLAKD